MYTTLYLNRSYGSLCTVDMYRAAAFGRRAYNGTNDQSTQSKVKSYYQLLVLTSPCIQDVHRGEVRTQNHLEFWTGSQTRSAHFRSIRVEDTSVARSFSR